MKIAAAYIRVSTDDQTEYSPAVQLDDILEFAKKNDYHIPKEFIFTDEGISGRTAEKRPAFQSMIRAARKKTNHIDAILVHKYDRFSRNKDDAVLYKALLKKDGVKVISIKEPIPQDDKFAVIYESMLEAMAEYYSLNLSEEVKKTMRKKAENGDYQARAPFGYRNDKKSLVIHPEEAEMVRYVFESYANGTSIFALTRELNQRGFRTIRGNQWEFRTVRYLLNNVTYHGYARWTPNGKTDWGYDIPAAIVAKGSWEPIIDDELWKRVQERYAQQKRRHYPHKRPDTEGIHWLSGKVKCSSCGRSLIISRQYVRGGFEMQCGGYNHGQCHVSHSVSSNRLIPAILDTLRQIADAPDTQADNFTIRTNNTNSGDIEAITSMIHRTQQKIVKAKEAYLAGIDTIDEYRETKLNAEKEIAELQQRLSALNEEHSFDADAFSEKVRNVLQTISGDSSMDDKKSAFSEIVEKVVYNKAENSIRLFLLD